MMLDVPIRPKVSIITVCFNSIQTVRDAIDSVLSQDYKHIEYIVVDGGSADGTAEVIRSYGQRISAFVCEPDGGIYDAMNKGICLATGEIVAFLNSDDMYIDPTVVTQLVSAMETRHADAAFADLVYVDRDDSKRVLRYYDSSRWRPSRLRFGWMPAHPTLFLRRACYQRLGGFSLNFRIAADFEMMVRLFHGMNASYTYLARPVVRMRAGGVSTRGLRHSWIINSEIVDACRQHGIWTALPLVLLKVPAKLLEVLLSKRKYRARLLVPRVRT